MTHAPRGVPVPVTGAGSSGRCGAGGGARRCRTAFPDGANWDGTDDTGTDGKSAQQLLLEREPSAAQAAAAPARTRRPEGAVAQLSEWLQIMLAEIARKQEEARQRSARKQQRRAAAQTLAPAAGAAHAGRPRSTRERDRCQVAGARDAAVLQLRSGFEGRAWPSWCFQPPIPQQLFAPAGDDRRAATAVTAFIGRALKGPVNQPIAIAQLQ